MYINLRVGLSEKVGNCLSVIADILVLKTKSNNCRETENNKNIKQKHQKKFAECGK